jgi:glucosamine-6-phosphate deaminase
MHFIIEDTEEEVGEDVAGEIQSLLEKKPTAVLGLATGSTPIPTYRQLIKLYEEKKIDFSKVTTFNLDEYENAPRYETTYKCFMHDNLFGPCHILDSQTHFPDASNPSQYDKDIKAAGGVDYQILGVGRNGHIGFNEPGTSFSSITHSIKLTDSTREANTRFFHNLEEVPTSAVSMGLGTIIKSKTIVLLATDLSKIEPISFLLSGKVSEEVPCSILSRQKNVEIFLTKEVYIAAKERLAREWVSIK